MLGGALLAYLAHQPRRCRPTARSTRTRCTWRPTSTCSRTTAGRWRPPRCSWSSRSSRSTSPTPMPARWPGRNFFARLTHSHPGRVVWVVFNTLIALMLMELDVFQALGDVLGLYTNIAIAWIMAVVADLVINKPLGLSPAGHRVQARAPVRHQPGGRRRDGRWPRCCRSRPTSALFGALAQAFSALIALVDGLRRRAADRLGHAGALLPRAHGRRRRRHGGPYRRDEAAPLRDLRARIRRRGHGALPGLPAARSARCAARSTRAATTCASRTPARAAVQLGALLRRLLPRACWPQLDTGLAHYLLLMAVVAPLLAGLLACSTTHELRPLGDDALPVRAGAARPRSSRPICALLLVAGVSAWWLVLTQQEPPVAQEESNRQTEAADARDRLAPPHRRSACRRAKRAADAGQPGQEPLHQRHQPRAAHAAEQHPGLRAAARRGPDDAAAPQAGGGRDPPRRRAPAVR